MRENCYFLQAVCVWRGDSLPASLLILGEARMEKHAGWLEVQQALAQPPRLGTRPPVPWPLVAQAAPTIPCAQPTSRMEFELSLCWPLPFSGAWGPAAAL